MHLKVKRALRESITDTLLGTVINFPINYAILLVCLQLSFTTLETTIALTVLMFFMAVLRKAAIRLWFERKYEIRRDSTALAQRQSD